MIRGITRSPAVGPALVAAGLLTFLAARPAVAHTAPLEALARADSALAAGGETARLHLERADLLRGLGAANAAERAYRRALELDAALAPARLGLVSHLLEVGRPLEALAILDEGPAGPPGSFARVLRARGLAAAGRPRDAERAFDAALAATVRPHPDLFLERADLAPDPAEAIRVLDDGIARLGGSAALELRAAEWEIARGDAGAAQRRIDRLERGRAVVAPSPGPAGAAAAAPGAERAVGNAGGAAVVRGPYLQNATPRSVVVRWRTDAATTSRVAVRRNALPAGERAAELSFEDRAVTTEHEITLGGLSPSTRYRYTIGTIGSVLAGGDSTYSFVTPPPPGPARPTRLWVLGDSGTGDSGARAVRDAYYAYPGAADTDFWLMLGDNAYDNGTDNEFQDAVFDMYPTFLRSHVLWLTRGNHDDLHGGEFNDYYELFTLPAAGEAGGVPSGTEAYYSFDWANIHLICLDSMSSDRSVTGAMHLWLEQDLAATNADWIVAFWHHPPYSKGSHDSDDSGDSGGRLIDMRENFLPLLESAGVDLVLTGHSHNYERSFLLDGHYGSSGGFGPQFVVDGGDGDPGGDGAYAKATPGPAPHEGAVYVVSGNSGSIESGLPLDHPAMFLSLSVLGSMVIDVDGNRLDAIHLDSGGNEVDRFAIVKGGGFERSRTAAGPGDMDLRLRAAGSPFRDSVRFDYAVPRRGSATLTVFDLHGRRVARLHAGTVDAGTHRTTWDGRDAAGRRVASGVYFAALTFDGQRRVRHVVKAR